MLEVLNVSKSFGSHEVLKGINLSVETGTIYGLVGRNGAGKTTLIRIIAGLAEATNGACHLDGTPIYKGNQKLPIGYLPDVPAFFDDLTIKEYLSFLLVGLSGRKRRARLNELLSQMKLEGGVKIKSLSRGQRQRLGIAAALSGDPTVLLLDEPTSALDPLGRIELMEILESLKRLGKSIILSTHILADMEKVCDKVGFLHNGVIQREISMTAQETFTEMKVCFSEALQIPAYDENLISVDQPEPNTLVVRLKYSDLAAQIHAFSLFREIAIPIQSIHSNFESLESIFQEVCV